MVYGIYYLLSYTWLSVGFLFHVILGGWLLPMRSWVLTDWLHTVTPCVSVCGHGQGHCRCQCRVEATVSFPCSPWVLPCRWRLKETNLHSRNMHIIHTSLKSDVLLLDIVTVLTFDRVTSSISSPLFCVLSVCVSSTSEVFRNIGWDSFTKCTLYVFQSLWEDPVALISVQI